MRAWTGQPRYCRIALLAGAAACLPFACTSSPHRPSATLQNATLRISDHVGGTHYRTVIHNGTWYQTFGTSLLALDPTDGSTRACIDLKPPGEAGSATDLLVHDRRLYVVLRDDAVIEITPVTDGRLELTRRITADRLGIRPRRLSLVAEALYVSGPGGAVRLADLDPVFRHDGDARSVIATAGGLAVTVGRRIYLVGDNTYLGSASELLPLPPDRWHTARFAFIRRGPDGASVGLMTENLREVDARRTTIRLDQPIHRLRLFDDRLWVVGEEDIRAYLLRAGELKLAALVNIRGARDVDKIDDNHLALAGVFGRAIYRRRDDQHGPGRTLIHVHREPCALTSARFDGRHILAGGPHGTWLYSPATSTLQPGRPPIAPAAPPRRAVTLAATAAISADGASVVLSTPDGPFTYADPAQAPFHCIVAVDGRFWLGHDAGITVLGAKDPAPAQAIAHLRLDGPVRFLFPLLEGGGAAYVSELAGIGVARLSEPP